MSSKWLLTSGGVKNMGPAFSAGQWPSLACTARFNLSAFFTAMVAFSYVMSSFSPTRTGGILISEFVTSFLKLFALFRSSAIGIILPDLPAHKIIGAIQIRAVSFSNLEPPHFSQSITFL